MPIPARQLVSTLNQDATITIEVKEVLLADPAPNEVIVEVEAAPINPSDMAGLFGPADLENATYSDGTIVAPMSQASLQTQAGRIGIALTSGLEGAGRVVAAGSNADAQALLGKRVSCAPHTGTFATHVTASTDVCIAIPDAASTSNASAAFVNPMTALGFVGTMKRQGYTALVQTAAASNLGQMLHRTCEEDGIALINIVRKPEQADLLRKIGAQYVLNSNDANFLPQLVDAIAETKAYCAFDAIGGGTMSGIILTAMEQAASRAGNQSRYGSSQRKHLYTYGRLDSSPIVLPPTIGFSWDISAWLLFPYLELIGEEAAQAMRERVINGIDTTFASHFSAEVTLEGVLRREAAIAINARRTGEKFLIKPGEF